MATVRHVALKASVSWSAHDHNLTVINLLRRKCRNRIKLFLRLMKTPHLGIRQRCRPLMGTIPGVCTAFQCAIIAKRRTLCELHASKVTSVSCSSFLFVCVLSGTVWTGYGWHGCFLVLFSHRPRRSWTGLRVLCVRWNFSGKLGSSLLSYLLHLHPEKSYAAFSIILKCRFLVKGLKISNQKR